MILTCNRNSLRLFVPSKDARMKQNRHYINYHPPNWQKYLSAVHWKMITSFLHPFLTSFLPAILESLSMTMFYLTGLQKKPETGRHCLPGISSITIHFLKIIVKI